MTKQGLWLHGFRWSAFATGFTAISQLALAAILARILHPADFAVVALAGVVINILLQLQLAGINAALIQREENTAVELSSLFWLNVLLGTALFMLAGLTGAWMEHFYRQPELPLVTWLYALALFIQGISVQFKSLLQKHLHFDTLSKGEILGAIFGFCMALATARYQSGPWALVAAYLGRYLMEGAWVILRGWALFQPSWRFEWQSLRPYFVFGSRHWAERLATHALAQLDILLVGHYLGIEALGRYDVIKKLLLRPAGLLATAIEKVAFPVFSSRQRQPGMLRNSYLGMLKLSFLALFPVYALLFALAPFALQLYAGPGWNDAIPLFRILCCWGVCLLLLHPVDNLLLATNRIHWWFWVAVVQAPLWWLALAWGSQYGIHTAIGALVVVQVIVVIFTYWKIVSPLLRINSSTN